MRTAFAKKMEIQKILLLTSIGDEAERIASLCRILFHEVEVHAGEWGDPLPEACLWWRGDLIISYCSRWKLPADLLAQSRQTMNFHPAPPRHRGAGGLNWALYLGEQEFGVTCHEMTPQLDAGEIYEVRTFPIYDRDDATTLYARTHLYLEHLAVHILMCVADGEAMPSSEHRWQGLCRTRRALDELATLSTDMSPDEVERRVRATAFRQWQPRLRVGQHEFELRPQPKLLAPDGYFS